MKEDYLSTDTPYIPRNDWTEDTAPTVAEVQENCTTVGGDIQKFTFDKECVETIAKAITGKSGQPVKISDEEKQMATNLMAYKLLAPILFKAFVDYLDHNKREDKQMCVSNMECEDIETAFTFKDWVKLVKYVKKFTNNLDFVKFLKDG